MAPESREVRAFSTPSGHFEWTRMPFGLKGAPLTFQRTMNNIFGDMLGNSVYTYLDDIIIASKRFWLWSGHSLTHSHSGSSHQRLFSSLYIDLPYNISHKNLKNFASDLAPRLPPQDITTVTTTINSIVTAGCLERDQKQTVQ